MRLPSAIKARSSHSVDVPRAMTRVALRSETLTFVVAAFPKPSSPGLTRRPIARASASAAEPLRRVDTRRMVGRLGGGHDEYIGSRGATEIAEQNGASPRTPRLRVPTDFDDEN